MNEVFQVIDAPFLTSSREPIIMSVQELISQDALLPFLPLVYVAWADGELSDREIEEIHAQASSLQGLSDDSRASLSQLLDPGSPPSATDLRLMLAKIRTHATRLSTEERKSLSSLGLAIAQIEGHEQQGVPQALDAMETALGLPPTECTQELLVDDEDSPLDDPALAPHGYRDIEPAATFDLAAMTRALDGKYHTMHERIRQVLQREEFVHQYEMPKAEFREQVLDWLQILADEGIGKKAFPGVTTESDDIGEFVAAFEALANFDLSLVVKFGVQFGLFGGSIYFLGTEKHHEKYLHDAASLELPGCFAMTELGHGSNVRDLKTTATYDSETKTFVIHTPDEYARKEWIGNAACHAKLATVFAQLIVDDVRYGVHALVVPIRDVEGNPMPGVFIEDCGYKLGLNGVDNGRLWFDNVRIPAENLLDRYASVSEDGEYSSPIASEGKRFFTMLGTLVGGRVSVGSAANTVAKSALTIATRYAAMRRQFGPSGQEEVPLLVFRTHQLRLMPLIADTYAANFGLHYLLERFTNRSEEDEREVEALAAGMKAWATWHATATVQTCRECCGGQGYLAVNRFADLKADSDIFTTFEGDNTVLMQLVARSLLSDYGQQFQDMNFMGTLRFLANRARAQLTELDPVTSRRTDREHLLDPVWQLDMMRHREQMLIESVARRFKSRMDQGMDSFYAMIDVQDHLVSTAHAHIERILLEQFIAAVHAETDEGLRTQLNALRELFGLNHLQQDLSWFMENSLVEAPKARAIRTIMNEICFEVRQQAVHLVDAFGIPESCLAAPIAVSPVVEPRKA